MFLKEINKILLIILYLKKHILLKKIYLIRCATRRGEAEFKI